VSISPLTKVLFVVHRDEKLPFLKFIQELGKVQITELEQKEVRTVFPELNRENSGRLNDLVALTSQIEFCIDFLSSHTPKKSILSALSPRELKKVDDLASVAKTADVKDIIDRVMHLSREISETRNTITKLDSAQDTFLPWRSLDVPIERLRDTRNVHQMLFMIFKVSKEEVRKQLNAVEKDYVLTSVSQGPDYSYYHFVCHKDDQDVFNDVLSKLGAERETLPEFTGTYRAAYEANNREIETLKKSVSDVEAEARVIASQKARLEELYDYYTMEKEQEEIAERLETSVGATYMEGWIPREVLDEVRKGIRERFHLVEMATFEHSENERPPILLRNTRLVRPFEVITSLYGMPDPKEFDPTPFYMLFYAIFFGLCLTDAGYGVVLSILLLFVMFRFKYSLGKNKIIHVLLIGSISTIILGAITGGWFGDLLPRLHDGSMLKRVGTSIMVFDPLKDTITFMLLCIGLGFIQVNLGMIVGLVKLLSHQERREAFVKFAWIVFINSAGILIAEYMSPGLIPHAVVRGSVVAILAASLGIIFFSQPEKNIFARIIWGVYNLYGCTGYLGDILSYLRLLALGLSTGIIASVVNLVAGLVIGVPYVGVVLAVVVFIGGHTFNIAINCLGAFVHTTRLQYVEFFTKFYEGTGRPFKPFGISPKYVYLREAVE
jgi:V/A-type H+-transporting ATPase subunit I